VIKCQHFYVSDSQSLTVRGKERDQDTDPDASCPKILGNRSGCACNSEQNRYEPDRDMKNYEAPLIEKKTRIPFSTKKNESTGSMKAR
jgi:hypothetical protein